MARTNRMWHVLRHEIGQLARMHASERRWQMPFAAALASGLPLLVGAFFGHMDYGLLSSLGGMVFLSLPDTPLYHRMVSLMACAFAMSACFALGLMSHFVPAVMMLVLTFTAILVTMLCRFYRLGPPGSLFYIMAASIGAYSPSTILDVPLKVGLVSLGSLLACLIAFFYSLHALRVRAAQAIVLPQADFDFVVVDGVVIGACVGLSLAVAQLLQLERAYWVPVSCLAVIQGISLRAVWTKQLQRIVGTAVGLLLAWGVLLLPLGNWSVSMVMIVLSFLVEVMVVRNYVVAAVFITPFTILLAEAATLGQGSAASLIHARFVDTVVGCMVGLIGGAGLHSARFRGYVAYCLRRALPARLRTGTGED